MVYLADQDIDNKFELYSAPSGGGSLPVKLNETLPPGRMGVHSFEIPPNDSRGIVYIADYDGVNELYARSIEK